MQKIWVLAFSFIIGESVSVFVPPVLTAVYLAHIQKNRNSGTDILE